MPQYSIHDWTPVVWEGPPPPSVRQHVITQVRPGTTNAQHVRLGEWGDEVTVRTVNYYSTFVLAMAARRRVVELLPARDLVRVWYCGIDYLTAFQHMYQVTNVSVSEVQMIARVVGYGLSLENPTKLVADITLVPHLV